MDKITVPARFAADRITADGEPARRWIAGLPDLVGRYVDHWSLTVVGEAMHGFVSLVVPVRTADGSDAVLKISWPNEESAHEATALAAWNGDGAVRLLATAPPDYALLLERLRGRTLADLPDVDEATALLGTVARRLHRPTTLVFPTLTDMALRWTEEFPIDWQRLGQPISRRLLDAALEVLGAPDGPAVLLHRDLHYENVLAGPHVEWVAIDPKPLVGNPGFDVAPALWNRWDELTAAGSLVRALQRRFAIRVEAAEIDRDYAQRWTVARMVDEVLWGAEADAEFAEKARLIAEAFTW